MHLGSVEKLEEKVGQIISVYHVVKEENLCLRKQLQELEEQKMVLRGRLDRLIEQLEGVD